MSSTTGNRTNHPRQAPHVYTDEEMATFRRMFDEGATYKEIGKALGLTRFAIACKCERLAWRRNKAWDAENKSRLETLVSHGWSDQRIAKAMGTTFHAIREQRSVLGIQQDDEFYSAVDVARLLGVHHKTIHRWLHSGYIAFKWLYKHKERGITWDALVDFLCDPAYWPAWDVDRLTDDSLRELAQEVRRATFYTMEQVAVMIGYSVDWTREMMVREARLLNLRHRYWIREDWFHEWLAGHPTYRRIDNVATVVAV